LLGLFISCTPVAEGASWAAAERLDEQALVFEPAIAMNDSGSAVAVWYDVDTPNGPPCPLSEPDAQDNAWARHYAPGEGWGPIWRLDLDGSSCLDWAYDTKVGLDADGHAVAVWTQGFGEGVPPSIWANSFVPEIGWGTALRLDDDSGEALRPVVAMNPAGQAVAVWHQFEENRADIWASHYTVEDGWSLAERVEIDATDAARDPQVDIDDQGRAIAVWNQFDGERFSVWTNRSKLGGGWGIPERISPDIGSARIPHVAVDERGRAIVVWRQSDGDRLGIWSRRFTPTARWEPPLRIDSEPGGDADGADVGVDAAGNAIAVWYQFDGTRFDVWSNRYEVGVGWGHANRIEANDSSDAVKPTLAVSANGKAVALWFEFDGTSYEPWSSTYTPIGGWKTAEPVDPSTEDPRANPWADIAIDPDGVAIAVWSLTDSSIAALEGHVWSARYE
jgi:hypothetical protein